MKSEINEKQIFEFLLGLYFDIKGSNYELAAIKRAYRDFNRTLERFRPKENDKIILRKNWTQLLLEKIEILKSSKFKNQEEFNSWHQSSCCQLIRANDNYGLTQGQAQKWINMSLKYLFVMGDERVSLISTNYQYFHIPIDNVIMNKLAEHGLAKFEEVWSKIADYD